MEARVTVRLCNKQGLHARPIKMFVDIAGSTDSEVQVTKVDHTVNGKSMLEMMTLGAPFGAELEILVRGEDAEDIAARLQALVDSGFGE